MINFFGEDVINPITNSKDYEVWIENTVNNENFRLGNLNIIFCSDKYLLEINNKYLKHDYYTDIITFDYSNERIKSGDLFISVDRVNDNANKFCVSFKKELDRVIIHGVLHLLNYNDKTKEEKVIMRSMENKYLKIFESVNNI